jgi:hypothetical protein
VSCVDDPLCPRRRQFREPALCIEARSLEFLFGLVEVLPVATLSTRQDDQWNSTQTGSLRRRGPAREILGGPLALTVLDLLKQGLRGRPGMELLLTRR